MSHSVKQPVGQKRLTNVAIVRFRKYGKRFEIACYKNKVVSWRNKVEKDIDEVLQSHTIYSHVSKGVLAKKEDLVQVFGTADEDKICLEILDHGELQVSDKEREAHFSSLSRDIATIVMDKSVNPETQRPYTVGMIERFMKEVHFKVDPNRSAKQQALELIRTLEKRFPISRARMKLRLTVPLDAEQRTVAWLKGINATPESEEKARQFSVVFLVDPGQFRACDSLARECGGRLEVVALAVQEQGDHRVDDAEEGGRESRGGDGGEALAERLGRAALDGGEREGESSEPVGSGRRGASEAAKPAPAAGGRQQKCNTCEAAFGDAKQFRDHFKSDWHRHNLKRKARELPPLSEDECATDTEVLDEKSDMDQYSR